MMMVEKNSREVLQPIIDWMTKNVTGSNNQAPAPRRGSDDSLALKLADTGIFWVGTGNNKKMPYGTIHVGQMFVQYLEPAQQRHPLPVILVHGGGGQMRALHGARRHVGLGAPLRAGRLQGVSRRSTGARPLAVSPRRARRDRPARHLRSAHARHGDVGAHAEQAVAGHDRRRRRSAGRSAGRGGQLDAARRAAGAVRCGGSTAPSSSIASDRASS